MANKVFGQDPKNFYKRNNVEAMEIITPGFYLQDDIDNFGTQTDPLDEIISSHINFTTVASQVLPISATTNYPDIQNVNGLSRFFIKQNENTTVTPFNFDLRILNPRNKNISDFSTSGDFRDYIQDTLLPELVLNTPTATDYATTTSGTHE